jgi:hypothetical protein
MLRQREMSTRGARQEDRDNSYGLALTKKVNGAPGRAQTPGRASPPIENLYRARKRWATRQPKETSPVGSVDASPYHCFMLLKLKKTKLPSKRDYKPNAHEERTHGEAVQIATRIKTSMLAKYSDVLTKVEPEVTYSLIFRELDIYLTNHNIN